jgi:hypothetical protein
VKGRGLAYQTKLKLHISSNLLHAPTEQEKGKSGEMLSATANQSPSPTTPILHIDIQIFNKQSTQCIKINGQVHTHYFIKFEHE